MGRTVFFFREVLLFGVCASASLVIGVLVMDQIVMPATVGKGDVIEVPDVVGLSLRDAKRMLTAWGLDLVVDEQRFHPIAPEGRVISQIPRVSSRVKKDRRIYLVLSKGQRLCTVPEVSSGISARQAELLIRQNGLEVGRVIEEPSYKIPKGVVISQEPSPGVELPGGSSVDLVVSKGPLLRTVKVPDLIGKDLKWAKTMLARSGLRIGSVAEERSPLYRPGTVIGQLPEAGTGVERGESLHLVLSKL